MKALILTVLLLAAPIHSAKAAPIQPVDTTTAGFVGMAASGPLDQPTLIHDYAEFTALFGPYTAGLANPYLAPSVAGFFANGGVQCVVVRVGAIDDATVIGTDGGAPGARTGLQALLDVDGISFIAVPGVATPTVQSAMITHCENAGDRLAVLDPSAPADLNAIQVQRAGLSTDQGFAALYFPWIQAAPDGTSLLLPPSGFVAGYYSATEAADSPVGVIATATGVAYPLTGAEQEIINVQGINGIRNLSGIRIWGARTLAADPEWKYVAVRRLGIFIEESITEGTAWCLEQPNDLTLWTTLAQDMDDFLYGLYRQGWLQGATPNDAYFANCGLGTTMTPTDLDEGRTVLVAGFAPLAPAEFVVLSIVHQRQDPSAAPDPVPASIRLSAPSPNPFNPLTTLRFELAEDAVVSLRIFDVTGRLVRSMLTARSLPAGEHRLRWNGRDDHGRAVGSGVYLIRLDGAGESRTGRAVLVR